MPGRRPVGHRRISPWSAHSFHTPHTSCAIRAMTRDRGMHPVCNLSVYLRPVLTGGPFYFENIAFVAAPVIGRYTRQFPGEFSMGAIVREPDEHFMLRYCSPYASEYIFGSGQFGLRDCCQQSPEQPHCPAVVLPIDRCLVFSHFSKRKQHVDYQQDGYQE